MTIQPAIASPGCGCDRSDPLSTLIGIDEALARIAAQASPVVRPETVPLERAHGRVLAAPVRSRRAAPPFDNAAMDGYAISTLTLTGPGPWDLRVVARVAAGQPATTAVAPGTAVRIFTGAPIPVGADAVVMQEDTWRDGDVLRLSHRAAPGQNIRRAGSDMAQGAAVLDPGRKLGPRDLAACAAAGAGTLPVRGRPRAALLVTGDELRRAGGARAAAQIWDVNTPMLTACLAAAGVDLIATAHAADSLAGLIGQMGDLAAQADLVVTTGGISVGEEDHVKPAVLALGGEIWVNGVAIKPGKPVTVGRIGTAHWLGLPGNPVSAFVTWQVFGQALLRGLTGQTGGALPRRHVVTAREIRRKPGRCELRPATLAGFDALGREVVQFDEATHSARVNGLALADGLMVLPAETAHLPAGALVEFQPFCEA